MCGLVRHLPNLIEDHSFLLHLSKNWEIVSSWEKLHLEQTPPSRYPFQRQPDFLRKEKFFFYDLL